MFASMVETLPVDEETYDYIVVGGGASGCPLANVLAEAGKILCRSEGGEQMQVLVSHVHDPPFRAVNNFRKQRASARERNGTKRGDNSECSEHPRSRRVKEERSSGSRPRVGSCKRQTAVFVLCLSFAGAGLADPTISQVIGTAGGIRTFSGAVMGGGSSINIGIAVAENEDFFVEMAKQFPGFNIDYSKLREVRLPRASSPSLVSVRPLGSGALSAPSPVAVRRPTTSWRRGSSRQCLLSSRSALRSKRRFTGRGTNTGATQTLHSRVCSPRLATSGRASPSSTRVSSEERRIP